MDIFLKRVTLPQEERHAGPSGAIPEEGIVAAGGDSSVGVTVSEDRPLGQNVEDSDVDHPDLV